MVYLIALVAAYFAMLIGLSVLARPYRVRLAALLAKIAEDYPDDPLAQHWCKDWRGSAYAWRAAPIHVLRFLLLLLIPGSALDERYDELERDHPELMKDTRVGEVLRCYYASISATNPIFGILLMLVRFAFRVKCILHRNGKNKRAQDAAECAVAVFAS